MFSGREAGSWQSTVTCAYYTTHLEKEALDSHGSDTCNHANRERWLQLLGAFLLAGLNTVRCARGQRKLGNRGRAPQMAPTAFSFCLFLGIKNVAW